MRLATLRIQNFRSFKDETINIDDYTCLVGANGAGKSTVLAALNVFFRERSAPTNVEVLSEEDFHNKDTRHPIKITAAFENLSDDAAKKFAHYLRQDKLIVSSRATWNAEARQATVFQYGERLGIPEFAEFFEAKNVAEQRSVYGQLKEKHSSLPHETTAAKMKAALQSHEQAHPDLCSAIESQDQFYGATKGASLLAEHVQWVYIPAVKDASTEQNDGKNTAIGKILDRTLRAKIDFDEPIRELKAKLEQDYQKLLAKEQDTLGELSSDIERRLQSWSDPDAQLKIAWDYDPDKSLAIQKPFAKISIGDQGFLGEISRLGHGMQRSFLVALLQELATGGDASSPKLILGFEEPELYQHPPQAQHLASVLEQLASGNAQAVMTTHSPYFASFHNFERVRMVRKLAETQCSSVQQATVKAISEALSKSLGEKCQHPSETIGRAMQVMRPSQREIFFCKVAVLVEGTEDVAYISTHLHLTGQWDDFRRHGCHFVVAGGKTNMSRPLAIANALDIPTFIIFDSDANASKDDALKKHEKDNKCLLQLCGLSDEAPLPQECLFSDRVVMWRSNIGDVVKGEFGKSEWSDAFRSVKRGFGISDHESFTQKNDSAIAETLEQLHKDGKKSPSLNKLSERLFKFAEQA